MFLTSVKFALEKYRSNKFFFHKFGSVHKFARKERDQFCLVTDQHRGLFSYAVPFNFNRSQEISQVPGVFCSSVVEHLD